MTKNKIRAATTKLPKVFIEKKPHPKLVKLIKEGNEGGLGEYEPYFPKKLAKIMDKENTDASYKALLLKDGSVKWVRIF